MRLVAATLTAMDWLLGTGEPSAESEEVDWAAGRAALEAAHLAPAGELERSPGR